MDFLDDLLKNTLTLSAETTDPQVPRLKEGERRVVSVLFADIKGFTELSERLDPEQVQSIIDRILKLFSASIVRHGGYVDKYQGDQIMALFGAKKASEHDTQKAVHTGLDMIDILQKLNAALAGLPGLSKQMASLQVRVGINTGLVTTGKIGVGRDGDFTAYGDTVNLASRMETNAAPNSIQLPEETMNLVRDRFDFEDRGTITVKGRKNKVHVFSVVRRKPQFDQIRIYESPYVGRTSELARLEKAYHAVKKKIGQQNTRLVSFGIKSEAGLGKSRFTDEFIRRRPELFDGKSLLVGQTDPYVKNPYGLFVSVLKRRFRIFDDDPEEEARNKLESGFAVLSERLGPDQERASLLGTIPLIGYLLGLKYDDIRLRELSGQALHSEIQVAFRHFLEAAAADANAAGNPLVLILEDLHWIDEGSESVLDLFASTLNLEELREKRYFKQILLILTYRPEYPPCAGLVEADFTELTFQPLDVNTCKQLIDSLTPSVPVSKKMKTSLLKKSGGNPFFIEEWVRYFRQGERGSGDSSIPDSLNALVLSRLDRLEDKLKLLVQKAAVFGVSFTADRLSALEKRLDQNGSVEPELEELSRQGWIQKPLEGENVFTFNHVLTQKVAYNTLLIRNRRMLHQLAAEVILDEGDRPEHYLTLYSHFRQTEDEVRQIEFGLKVADRLKAEYQNSRALKIYDEVLGIVESDDLDRMIEIKLKKAKILLMVGAHGNPELKTLLEETIKLTRQTGAKRLSAEAMKDLGWLYYLKGEIPEAIDLFNNALKQFEEINDNAGMSRCIGNLGVMHWRLNDYDSAMACNRKQLELSEGLGDQMSISIANGNMGYTFRLKGAYEEALNCFSKQLAISERLHDKEMITYAVGNMGQVHRHRGDIEQAMACYDRALEIDEEIGHKNGLSRDLIRKADLLHELGNNGEAAQLADKGLQIAEELGRRDFVFKGKLLTARIAFARGRRAPAITALESMLKETAHDTETATLKYELWQMTGASDRRKEALELYRKLSVATKKLEFTERLRQLETAD